MRICVICSNQMVGDLLQEFLISHRHSVRLFLYDEQLLDDLSHCSHWADLIIVDAECPKSRFLSVVEEIHARFPAIPIVLVSSTGKVLLPEDAIRNGVYGYLHKPVSLAELELMLVRIDETKKWPRKARRQSEQK